MMRISGQSSAILDPPPSTLGRASVQIDNVVLGKVELNIPKDGYDPLLRNSCMHVSRISDESDEAWRPVVPTKVGELWYRR